MINPKIVRDLLTLLAIFTIISAHHLTSGLLFGVIVGLCVAAVMRTMNYYHTAEAELAKAKTTNKKRK